MHCMHSASIKLNGYNIILPFYNILLKGCSTDYFKDVIGNEECRKCPVGKTNNAIYTGCKCKEDHYPGNGESCYGKYRTQITICMYDNKKTFSTSK